MNGNDDDVLRFEVTDSDLNHEFNFENKRPRQSKNKAIYGIWAENSDEDSETEFDVRRGSKKSYTTPIDFVSGGITGKTKDLITDSEDEEEEKETKKRNENQFSFQRPSKQKVTLHGGGLAGLRTNSHSANISLGKGFGDWEKHTKGIGAKLLLKMGFQAGKGLGKDLQGRSSIIEAHLRKGKGAIGAYGKEGNAPEIRNNNLDEDDENDPDNEKNRESQNKLHHWKKKDGKKQGQIQYVYKTLDEILEKGQSKKLRSTSNLSTKVIDMTGKESRVLSGYHAIASSKKFPNNESHEEISRLPGETHFDLPELTHNLNAIVDLTEEAIILADRKYRHHRDRIIVLTKEEEKLNFFLSQEKNEILSLENVLDSIVKMEKAFESGTLNLSEALHSFTQMKEKWPIEYVDYELPFIAKDLVGPLLKDSLTTWNVLSFPSEKLNLLSSWKNVLHLNPESETPEGDPYHSLLWESWMPSVRIAVSLWQCRIAPELLITFITVWSAQLIPKWLQSHILLQLVLPKLQNEVENWNPLTDKVPIHTWLQPWLPLLDSNLEIVYPVIRHKLGTALNNWNPSDRSAKLIIIPWKDVFSKSSMATFLSQYIVPKLEASLSSMNLTPGNYSQYKSIWNAFLDWKDLISVPVLVSILEKVFFPKWLQVLASWLNHIPNYDEVSKWYQEWKNLLPDEILSHPATQVQLTMALDMMNRSLGIESVPRYTKPPSPSIPRSTSERIPLGFKDLVAKRCEERGILFAPVLPLRFKEGKQIYRCGNYSLYLDKNVIFVHQAAKNVWVPTSLNSLLDFA